MARSILRRAGAWKATEDAPGSGDAEGVAAAPAIHHEAETTLAASSPPPYARERHPAPARGASRVPQTREGAGTRAFGEVPAPSRCDAHDAHVTLERRATSC